VQETERRQRLRALDILEAMEDEAPVFIGFSPVGPKREPVEIRRWGQFIVKFGSYKKCGYLATSVNGFFLNGGSRCHVLNLGERSEALEERVRVYQEALPALDQLERLPFILAPGEWEPEVHEAILAYCERRATYAVLDGPEELVERRKEEEGEQEESGEEDAEKDERYENMPLVKGGRGMVVYPWIYLRDRVLGDFFIPPAGHVAGILARLYREGARPEHVDIAGTVYMKYKFTAEEMEPRRERGISFLEYADKYPALMLSK